MKILYENYLTDSTVTASSEDSDYPKENLYDKFLSKKFMAEGTTTKVTVLFPEDREVSMIAYGFNNITSAESRVVITKGATDKIVVTKDATDKFIVSRGSSYELKSSSGTTLMSGQLTVGDDVNVTTIDTPVTCRSVEIDFAADGLVYLGGLSVGNPLEYMSLQTNPSFATLLRSTVTETNGGQVIGKQIPSLRQWNSGVVDLTNTDRKETMVMLETVGTFQPFFTSYYAGDGEEEAMYGRFTKYSQFSRDSYSKLYSATFTIKEAR